ncbi:hypothetical protein [Dyella mobilis]|uniref:GAF domain-containing protein n=1 Tax=Dyella mobilis TaxID=1849582 RepID=A0ABS2KEE1_9GAMM|nr:hypothetical protein [Dyella mobilis]MBM7129541.1 hypothetical protein [Dyella mobilis]GLQ98195.1 hypothetical protein GCM10007863_26150 [Dyella mobilis]
MTASSSTVASQGEPARVSRYWQVFIVVLGLLVLVHNAGSMWDVSNGFSGAGSVAEGSVLGDLNRPDPDGYWSVIAVMPGSPLAMAGVRQGDAIGYDRAIDGFRSFRAGQAVGFTLRRNGAVSHHEMIAVPVPAASPAQVRLVVFLSGIMSIPGLIGVFVALRSGRRASTLLLGAALICLSCSGNAPNLAESAAWFFPAFYCVATAVKYAPPVLFLAFALVARRETSGNIPRGWMIALGAYALMPAVLTGNDVWSALVGRSLLNAHAVVVGRTTLLGAGLLLAIFALGAAWREARGMDRTRYAFMLVAIGLLSCLELMGVLINLTGTQWTLANPLVLILIVCTIMGASVFAYAVLRHRVIDIGFAVNRTLVYAVVSASLLATFGLVEWAVDHFVSIGGREKNVLVDAAVAVGVFLAFHRVRDWVEHVIESLFFSHWKKAEADLRRFVKEASFVTEASSLASAFARALSHYTGGAEAAVYVAEKGSYTRAAGSIASAPAELDVNLPALVSVRAAPEPIEAHEGALTGCLVAPMINRNELIGVAIVGPKPSGHALRPDEIELIGWATRHVGLDLHALKIEQLNGEIDRLNGQIAAFQAETATLRSLVTQRA